MAGFNTHGGYFAPAGYMRINEGGSHEENPNGGVQVGVDQQGTPNVLEEGEPVYEDFVFSDNITADVKFLIEAGVPKQYAGKLYSEIVDDLFKEAEERPNDPISKNGLDAMLSRVAQAQEAQKAAEEEAQLMEELQNMSPEELAALEQSLAQEQVQQPEQEMMPVGQMPVAPEQVAVQPQEVMPMMALGGPMNKFAMGGDDDPVRDAVHNWYEANRDKGFLEKTANTLDRFFNGSDFIAPDGEVYPLNKMLVNVGKPGASAAGAVGSRESQIKSFSDSVKKWQAEVDKLRKAEGFFAPYGSEAMRNLNASRRELSRLMREAPKVVEKVAKTVKPVAKTSKAKKIAAGVIGGAGTAATIGAALIGDKYGYPDVQGNSSGLVEIDENDFACGGKKNRYDWGGEYGQLDPATIIGLPTVYSFGQNLPAASITGMRGPFNKLPNNRYDVWSDGRFLAGDYASYYGRVHAPGSLYGNWDPAMVTASRPAYNTPINLREATITASRQPIDLGMLGEAIITASPNEMQPIDLGTLSEAVITSMPTKRTGTTPNRNVSPVPPVNVEIPRTISDAQLADIARYGVDSNLPANPATLPVGKINILTSGNPVGYSEWLDRVTTPIDEEVIVASGSKGRVPILSTLSRYAGAVGSGLLALNTLLQDPDHYEDNPVRPVLPTGRIQLQDERYMPIDMNMVTNQMQAQNQANARALLNSGAGPATGALLNAADYVGAQNFGNALANVWQANNQERNRVISANNQNAATRAQFYRDLDSERTRILNNAAMYNNQNAFRIAMLNNQAEQEKYNAFSQNLGNSLKALSDIGNENFAMNQVNTNSAFGWYVGPDGKAYYRGPKWGGFACGGSMKKK